MTQLQLSPESAVADTSARSDLYGPVHRGLRWAFANLLARLGSTDFGDAREREAALDELDGLLDLCVQHLSHENETFHPALELRRPGSTAALGAEHDQHLVAIAELRALAARISVRGGDAAAPLGRELYLAYSSFVADNLLHMAEEETLLEPLFHAAYSDAELDEMLQGMLARVPPEEKMAFLCVMIPAASREERAKLLVPVLGDAPPPVVQAILSGLRPTLSAADFADLERRLARAA
jgi:hemerythrin HHE cation binding domain-containing protein